MNKKVASGLIILILLLFLGYIIYDVALRKEKDVAEISNTATPEITDSWKVTSTIDPASGKVESVGIMKNDNVVIGGDSFVACYDPELRMLWNNKTDRPVTSISASGDTIFTSTTETIRMLDPKGRQIGEWGPFEDSAMITSVSANISFVVFADARNKVLMVLDKKGDLKSMIGKSGEPFILPSPYFDVAIDAANIIYVANTGKHRIEKRKIDGTMIEQFGGTGTSPEFYCGCCNPAHFALVPGGFVTAEKGINRIKILNSKGEFVEFISSVNKFTPSIPLVVASSDGKTIYGANPADSKVYIFNKKLN
ncbi:MAG: hypothetical protein ABR927_06400 [Bacteroidales bacterium]|jgi:DNA-binding beta-propeller fold protein YncE